MASDSSRFADKVLEGMMQSVAGDPKKVRLVTGGPIVDWRSMFVKYAELIKQAEGYYFLNEAEWTPEEWAAITALPGMERPV